MELILKGMPHDLPPGKHEVELREVSEDRLLFELCDPKQAEQAAHWRAAVSPIRSVSGDIQEVLDDMERHGAHSVRISAGRLQDWANTLNTACP